MLALCAACIVVITPEHSRPPERIVTTSIARPINPTALPESVASTTTTTTTEPPTTTTTVPRATKSVTATDDVAVPSGDALTAIAKHFPDVYDQAVGVARCESTLNPGSISRDGRNWGLFQVNIVHRSDFEQFTGRAWFDAVLDADANAAYARKLYDGLGWQPWACRWAAR